MLKIESNDLLNSLELVDENERVIGLARRGSRGETVYAEAQLRAWAKQNGYDVAEGIEQ